MKCVYIRELMFCTQVLYSFYSAVTHNFIVTFRTLVCSQSFAWTFLEKL